MTKTAAKSTAESPAPIFEKSIIERAVAELRPFEKKLKAFEDEMGSVVYDLSDPEQLKACKSDRLKVAKVISALDKKHAEIKAPIKELSDKLDSIRRTVKDRLDVLRVNRLDLVKKHEEALAKLAEGQIKRVEACKALAVFRRPPKSVEIEHRIAEITQAIDLSEADNLDPDIYGNHLDSAKLALHTALRDCQQMLAQTKKAEEDEARMAEARQALADERAQMEKEKRELKMEMQKLKDDAEKAAAEAAALKHELQRPKVQMDPAAPGGEETVGLVVQIDNELPTYTAVPAGQDPDLVSEINPPPEDGTQEEEPDLSMIRMNVNMEACVSLQRAVPALDPAVAKDVVRAIVINKVRHVSISYHGE